jgi:hypothetical protein
MTRVRRWTLVGVLVAVLLALPSLVGHLPVSRSDVTAANLLGKIQTSESVPFSGYGEATGGLALPVTDQFNSIADLFGGTTTLRAWWRGSTDWRVDTIDVTGEDDLHQDATGSWDWNYESNTATRVSGASAPVRLPRADDLLAPTLARRLLSQASADEVTRLADRRIAGRDAAGLRLVPSDPQTTISHVDVWAVASSGLAVAVEVYGKGSTATVLTSDLLDLSTSTPSPSTIAFTPPVGAKIRVAQRPDIVASLNQLGRVRPPSTLAGLPREQTSGLGSVGVYGRGVTLMIAIPLPPRFEGSIAKELQSAVGVTTTSDGGSLLNVGPVNLLLTPPMFGSAWLLAGTVDAATMQQAAASELPLVFGPR